MKKLISLFSAILMITALFTFPVHAQEIETIEYLPDGSYFITTTTTNNSSNESGIQPLSSTTTAGKDVSYYTASDIKVFTYRVVGTFEYDGNTATCTKASSGLIYIHSDCQSTTYSAYASGNKAIGNISTYYHGVHITKTVTLTCDKNGNLS